MVLIDFTDKKIGASIAAVSQRDNRMTGGIKRDILQPGLFEFLISSIV